MADWNFLAKEFKRLGINNYQCWDVIPLDKVFGLNETKDNRGLYPYGVSDMSLFDRGVSITLYKGDICKPINICSQGRIKEAKNARLLTNSEEQGVEEYCMKLINDRKKEIEENKYWLEHFDDFTSHCLEIAKKYVSEKSDNKYYVELGVGNSLADTRVAPALIIRYSDGSQRGYIKILQSRFGDIHFDACCMCHTKYSIDNPNDIESVVRDACDFCI